MQPGESLTLIQIMDEFKLHFISAGRDSGAEAGQTHVKEGVAMLNDSLSYDEEMVELTEGGIYKFNGKAPTMYVSEVCKNMIFCASNWTGLGGGANPMKDPIDVWRYLRIAGPTHFVPRVAGSQVPFGY
jgi:hypothetical protein